MRGLILYLLLGALGLLVTWQKDIRHDNNWYGNYYSSKSFLLVRVDEPLVEKNKSYKADGYVEAVFRDGNMIPGKGKLLLYFSKDSLKPELNYGDRILIGKTLLPIKNSGNPGAFNYQRYAAFQQIFHNVFLKGKDWVKTKEKSENTNWLQQFIFSARDHVLSVLRQRVEAGKDELGIAEALLIGYTNDLDKDLVQAYSNTGVVHIIAISGMHLGLIYVLLVWLFARIPVINKSKYANIILILACLWFFAFITGASSSVLRAAVMFSFISLGKTISKQSSIYNSLAVSAFVMLCFNPYYLWAVGFQLSYLAVIGIVVFQKPIYNCLYLKNKWLDRVWALVSVSTAAQLLTFPACIYYFHQFPNLFLISNIVAVPLATLILYAAIALIAFSWIPVIAIYLGKLVAGFTYAMNKFILWINELSFAVWDRIPASVLSTWLLYSIVIAFSAWLMTKNKKLFKAGMICLLVFTALLAYNRLQIEKQQKIIVYNVPQHQAIDFVNGTRYQFIGDSILLKDGLLQNFHLKPGRIFLQLDDRVDSLNDIFQNSIFYQYGSKRIAIIDRPLNIDSLHQKIDIDLIIISKNPGLYISRLTKTFNCRQYIFDASNPLWKIEKWQRECVKLNVKGHSVPGEGAFIYDIGI